jgi:hypothetical protein
MLHAPVHYQDTHDEKPRADFLAAFDYDGDWIGWNNWNDLDEHALPGTVYYSVAETCTHWFVVYAFFHPQDWGASTSLIERAEHENDVEGLLAIVAKDGSATGRLDGVVTVFHNDFFSFVPEGSPLVAAGEDIDGTLSFETWDGRPHPMTSQEAEGHGLEAWPFAGDFDGVSGDGVRYVPAWTGAEPASGDEPEVPYALRPLDEIWAVQLAELELPGPEAVMFADFGVLEGNDDGSCGDGATFTCATDAAHLPWAWDDGPGIVEGGDGVLAGAHALDPATLADTYFDGATFALDYVANGYLEDLRDAGFDDASPPHGLPSGLSLDALYDRLGATCD